jgi:uncharacterized protein YecT (DUF1311 family)
MIMRTILAFLFLLPAACLGADECSDKPECWPEGSAMRTGLLRRAVETDLRSQLQQSFEELVTLLSTKKIENGIEYLEDQRLVEAFQAQHKMWNQFKDAECELIGSLSGGASTWQSARAVQCESNLTDQRLTRMRHAIGCINRILPEKRRFSRQACLYQLAPLAVPLEK